ncbi:hypothetical protein F4679DRAFT_594533 [Xylaria curta]|nr:hypothetical protein F4679DRAFT_594533 [Xylaria curta]
MLSIIPILALFLLTPVCMAAAMQDDRVFPQKTDNSTILQLGRKYKVQWPSALQDWFYNYCPDCIPTSVDLWVTDSFNHKYHKIASSVDVTSTLSISWIATVPATELSNFRTWILQFVPNEEDPRSTSDQIYSSILIITDPGAPSSSVSVSSPTLSSTTPASTNPTTTSNANTPTETTMAPLPNSELTTGAKAGIGVGIGAGAVVVFTLGWCLAHYYGRKSGNLDIGGTRTLHATASQTAYQDPPAYTGRRLVPMSVNDGIRVSHNSLVEMI